MELVESGGREGYAGLSQQMKKDREGMKAKGMFRTKSDDVEKVDAELLWSSRLSLSVRRRGEDKAFHVGHLAPGTSHPL
jgi:hypothetical protein